MTPALLLGTLGFALFLLYDVNSVTARRRALNALFPAGCALVCAATALLFYGAAAAGALRTAGSAALLALGALCFALLLYSLFFALPFSDTYVDPQAQRRVYDGGVYALCRHPGVLCFFFTYLFWGLAAPGTPFLRTGMIFSLLNLLYALFQDRWSFPRTFADYAEYRERVPFLIPTGASIRATVTTWPRPERKKDAK